MRPKKPKKQRKGNRRPFDWHNLFPFLTRIVMEGLLLALFVITAIDIILKALRNL